MFIFSQYMEINLFEAFVILHNGVWYARYYSGRRRRNFYISDSEDLEKIRKLKDIFVCNIYLIFLFYIINLSLFQANPTYC